MEDVTRRVDFQSMLARPYYLARAEAKVSYLLPLVMGVQVAGARIVSIQARWALAAVTGRTTWPRKLYIPIALLRQACAGVAMPVGHRQCISHLSIS